MRTSAPGNRPAAHRPAAARGFPLIELLVVVAIIAIATAVVAVAMRDGTAQRLEQEARRVMPPASCVESAIRTRP